MTKHTIGPRFLLPLVLLAVGGHYGLPGWAGEPPPVEREFRAAWIATVANIDWPSRPGLPAAQQRRELVALLDLVRELRMNAVVLQVRPACDAMYPSRLEPWSEFLTGTQGEPPDEAYDPLEFAVAEAHRRGLELHAWFNPYRASHPSGKGPLAESHVSNQRPELVRQYGDHLWLDPGSPEAAQYSRQVIRDVVTRYDIDAVHFDDYFYPYPVTNEQGEPVPFPDEVTWEAYCQQTPQAERLSRDDWRRENVNQFLRDVRDDIQRTKPWVRFGISPFGIYRPGQPESIRGFDAYARLYADARLWLTEGIVDYLSPQLYWPIDQQAQSFPVLLRWWSDQNVHERHVWPGLFTSKVLADGAGWDPREIVRQIDLVRSESDTPGHIHFSIKAISQNRSGLQDLLARSAYADPALPPATPWCELPERRQAEPEVAFRSDSDGAVVTLANRGDGAPWLWVVQWQRDGDWTTNIVPGAERSVRIDGPAAAVQQVTVRFVDRLGQLSELVRVPVEQPSSAVR